MSKQPKCHAAQRLAERYGVKLTLKQCMELARLIVTPEAQQEYEFLKRAADTYRRATVDRRAGFSRWWINFEFLIGRKLWALAVVDERKPYIVTFLPPHAI